MNGFGRLFLPFLGLHVLLLLSVPVRVHGLNMPRVSNVRSSRAISRITIPAALDISSKVKASSSCPLFKTSPEIRKIVISYLHKKLSIGNTDEDHAKVFCDREKLSSIIKGVMPPVSPNELTAEVSSTMGKFERHFVMGERRFSSKILMENSIWRSYGETVVKELIYLDCLHQQESISEDNFLSHTCFNKLEASLAEDGSPVLKLSKDEIGLAYALVAALNGIQPLSKEHRSLDETAFSFLFFDSGDRFSCCDCYGNPTLIRIIADRIAAGGFTQAAEAAEAFQSCQCCER